MNTHKCDLKPIVSVIVTTYNRKELLKVTIDSILAQTYKYFELIIVDNYSSYDFISYIETFNDNRVLSYQNQNNGIIAVNRNFGMRRAKGQYIAFCDDDDYWKTDKLEIQLKNIKRDDIIGVGSTSIFFGDLKCYRQQKIRKDLLLDYKSILKDYSVPLSSLIVKNNGILFDESDKFKYVEDFEFQLRLTLSSKKSIKLLASPLIYYRKHIENKSQFASVMTNIFSVYKKYEKLIPQNTYKLIIAKQNINLGIKSIRCGDNKARKYFIESLKHSSGKMKYRSFLLIIFASLPSIIRNRFIYFYYKVYNTL